MEVNEEVKEVKPKRSWAKRHKVALIITAIGLVIIIAPLASLLGFLWYANAWNDGMGLPEGFGRANYPFTESTKGISNILRYQFKEENTPKVDDAIYFIYNNEKYRLQSNGRTTEELQEHIVYKDADETKIGSLKSEADSDIVYSWDIGWILFFDDHYIYYMFNQTIRRWYFELGLFHPITEQEWLTYDKYTFHRFDLDTCNNEEVSINLFVEKLNKYDETLKIK